MLNTENDVRGFKSDGDLIFINHSSGLYGNFLSLNRTTNTLIDSSSKYVDSFRSPTSISRLHNRIIGRTSGISLSDVIFISYNDTGRFSSSGDSPQHGDYASAEKTWVFPDESRVIDDSGNIYTTTSLRHVNAIMSKIRDLDWLGADVLIVLEEDSARVTAYSSALLPTGSFDLTYNPLTIKASSNDVVTFTPKSGAPNDIQVHTYALELLSAPEPGKPLDPKGVPYKPNAAFMDRNGILYLFSEAHSSLFLWDFNEQAYLSTIPLVDVPKFVAYSYVNHEIYTLGDTRLIRKLDLSAEKLSQEPFATLASSALGLATAGSFVFACDSSGTWVSHCTFHRNSTPISAVDWNYRSQEYIWNEVNI